MKPTKPDRFDEIVKAKMEKDGGIWSDSAADLLRNEHAWMRRMVTNYLSKWTDRTGPSIDAQEAYGRHCRALQCGEILAQLDQRRK